MGLLSILTIALLSQQFVRYLNYVAIGKVPANAILALVSFEIPYLFVFLLPLSIYLGMLWVYSRLQLDHEMLIMEMSGFDIKRLLGLTLGIASFVALMVLVLMMWVNPLVSIKREMVFHDEESASHLIQTLVPGRFHVSADEKRVIYVETLSRDRTEVGHVFIAEHKESTDQPLNAHWNITVAQDGRQVDGARDEGNYFVLHHGYRYDGIPGQNDYKILGFNKYGIRIPENNMTFSHSNRESLPLSELLSHLSDKKHLAELQWRIAMPIATIVLSMIALSLSYFSPRQNRYKRLIPAMLIFIIYVNLLMLSKRWIEDGSLSPWFGLWWVHILFLALGLYFIRRYYYQRG